LEAAAAANAVVVESVVDAVKKGGLKLDESGPTLQKLAAKAVSKPTMPNPKRKSARARVKGRKAATGKAKRASVAAKKKHG
jgi:hypothetical protein